MELPYEAVFPLAPAEVFERLRHFARFYPDLHPAHEPHPAGAEMPLLAPAVAFTVAERFGAERRTYAFRVARYEPDAPGITLEAETLTVIQLRGLPAPIGQLRIRSALTVDWRVEPDPAGARLIARQTVRLGWPWLAPLLLSAPVRRKITAHAVEETSRAFAILAAADWPRA